MELGVSLTQHQQQRLLLLPRMLQAIEILQLSSRDLVALIDKELSENETLEVAASTAESAPSEPAAAVTEEPAWEDGEEWSLQPLALSAVYFDKHISSFTAEALALNHCGSFLNTFIMSRPIS